MLGEDLRRRKVVKSNKTRRHILIEAQVQIFVAQKSSQKRYVKIKLVKGRAFARLRKILCFHLVRKSESGHKLNLMRYYVKLDAAN